MYNYYEVSDYHGRTIALQPAVDTSDALTRARAKNGFAHWVRCLPTTNPNRLINLRARLETKPR